MDQDKFALVEKVLKDLHIILSKNAELSSFEIVPVNGNSKNKSPVLHFENCLGLESWCVKHVFMYCYSELMDKYFDKPNRKALRISAVNIDRPIKLLNVTLLLNPELNTLWNKRRELVLRELLDISAELWFSRLALTRKPKCNEAFAYRRWLFEELFQGPMESQALCNLFIDEMALCKLTADTSPNNYHSWSHRTWFCTFYRDHNGGIYPQIISLGEYEFSELWTAKHVSDFSCFHYRQFCIKILFDLTIHDQWKGLENKLDGSLRKSFVRVLANHFPKNMSVDVTEANLVSFSEKALVLLVMNDKLRHCDCQNNVFLVCMKLQVLFHELVLNNGLVRFYKHHETLWYHRRFIVHELLLIMYDYFGVERQNGVLVKTSCGKCHPDESSHKQAKIVRYDSNSIYSSVLYNVILSHEQNIISEMKGEGDNYADRHEKYLKFVEGFKKTI